MAAKLLAWFARKTCYTFTIALVSVLVGQLASLYGYCYFYGSACLRRDASLLGLLPEAMWYVLLVLLVLVSAAHYTAFGVFRAFGRRVEWERLRILNDHIDGLEVRPGLSPQEASRLVDALHGFPLWHTLVAGALGAFLFLCLLGLVIRHDGRILDVLYAVQAAVLSLSIYMFVTYVVTEHLSAAQRSAAKKAVHEGGGRVREMHQFSLKVKFAFFVALLMVTLAVLDLILLPPHTPASNRAFTTLFMGLSVLLCSILVILYFSSIFRSIQEARAAALDLASGGPGLAFSGSMDLEFVLLNRSLQDAADEVHLYRTRMESLVGQKTRDLERSLEQLGESERRFRSLVENGSDLISIIDAGGRRIYLSPSAERVLGYRSEDLIGENPFDLVHPDDLAPMKRKLEDAVRHPERIRTVHYRIRHADGSWRTMEGIGQSLVHDPAVGGVVVNSRDITERRAVEERVLRQSALLDALNEVFRETLSCETMREVAERCLAVAITLTSSQTGFIAEEDMKGRFRTLATRPLEWHPLRRPDACAPGAEGPASPGWEALLAANATVLLEDPASRPELTGPPVPGRSEGAPLASLLAVPLGSDKRRPGMIVVANKAEGYTWHDRKALETLSVAFVEALDRKRAEEEIRKHRDHLEEIVAERTDALLRSNLQLQKEIGDREQAEREIKQLNEGLERRVKERTDELVKAYQELKNLDRMKDTFLSSVSHELRTPLTSIRSFSEILLSYNDVDTEARREFLQIINSESERLTRLINDVLDLSRIEAGGTPWHDDDVGLPEVIQDAVQTLHRQLEEQAIELTLDVEPDLPPVFADRDRLQQVVTNLLGNAIKFSFQGGRIRLAAGWFRGRRAGDPRDWLHVSVTDEGLGLDEKDFEVVFDKFRQVATDDLKDKPQGTGLGLPICKEIVAHYGGNIWVEGRKGAGCTFHFTLPGSPPAGEARTDDGPTRARSQKRILVLNDNPTARKVLRYQLERKGFTVIEASTTTELLEGASAGIIDLIVLDLMVPVMRDADVLEIIRQSPRTRKTPVLLTSVVEDDRKGILPGAHGVLRKPFREEELIQKVRSLLGEEKRSVLVVDDDAAVRETLRMQLEERGYPVYVAADGEEAIDLMELSVPDLVILDVVMPGKNGYDVLRWMRKTPSTANLPTIILSGCPHSDDRIDLLSMGVDAYVEKSEGLSTLFERIDSVFGIPAG